MIIAVLVLALVALVACGEKDGEETTTAADTTAAEVTTVEDTTAEATTAVETTVAETTVAETTVTDESGTEETTEAEETKSEGVMTYAQYVAAAVDDPVVIETYVQAKQSWWDNKATIYTQDKDGAYFIYEMVCSEEDYAKLTPGTKIKVTGFKSEWAGEVELASGATFEIIEGAGTYVAPAFDATALLGTDDLIKHQNELCLFKDAEVVAYNEGGEAAFAYKNAEQQTDDLYFKVKIGDKVYDFCVEFYLCGKDTDVYKAVEGLKVGDKIDIEGFLYWYNGANPHTTKITVK